MKPVNKQILKEVAAKLMFDMDEDQYDTLLKEFDIIIKQMEIIGTIPNVDEVEPMTFPYAETTTNLREDNVIECLDKQDVFKNTNDVVNDQIRLPRVIRK